MAEELQTWDEVRARVDSLGRGAPYRLAQRLGMNTSYFYRKLKSESPLTARQAQVIKEFLEGPDAVPTRGEGSGMPSPGDRTRLPLYGYAAGSDGDIVALNEGNILDWIELPMGLRLGPGDYFAVRPIGSSMEPRIFAGETLIVRRNYPPARDKDFIAEFTDGSGVIKTYKGQRDGRVFAEQFNPPKTLDYDATRVKALHAVAFKL